MSSVCFYTCAVSLKPARKLPQPILSFADASPTDSAKDFGLLSYRIQPVRHIQWDTECMNADDMQ
eukprot:scaffold228821_cov21-Prasinocladus_malaysianus.AAC.1